MRPFKFRVGSMTVLAIFAAALLNPTVTQGNIFVANSGNGTIGEYTDSGITVNPSLISELNEPYSIAVSGSNLFVASLDDTINEYTTSGAAVSTPLVSVGEPTAIAVSGSDLFVYSANTGTIGEYTTSGEVENASLITGLDGDCGVAVSGSDLFVASTSDGTVREYTTSGTLLASTYVSGGPVGIAVSGSDVFVGFPGYPDSGYIGEYSTPFEEPDASEVGEVDSGRSYAFAISGSDLFAPNYGDGTVGEYTTSGTAVNADLISGLDEPYGIAISDVPEPAALSLLLLGGVSLLWRRRQFVSDQTTENN